MGALELQINAGKETETNSMISEESPRIHLNVVGSITILGKKRRKRVTAFLLLHDQAVTVRYGGFAAL